MNGPGAVVIGRNESAKLPRCLSSVLGSADPVVYVDSGSDDGSSELARRLGADVVELDSASPFTVARARNAGLDRVRQIDPRTEFVQFVDADSEIVPSWMACAKAALAANDDLAAVFGRVRERHPERSLYSRLYQAEFDLHFAQSDVCGGMGMMRIAPVQQLHGFNTSMRGFEDFDLSRRLRRAGWQVRRLDAEMAVHDSAMSNVAGWWRRHVRSGYALGQQRTLEDGGERSTMRACWSAWGWGLVLPAIAVAGTLPTGGFSLLMLAAYPAQICRVSRRLVRSGPAGANAVLYAGSLVLGKCPEAVGLTRFRLERAGRQ